MKLFFAAVLVGMFWLVKNTVFMSEEENKLKRGLNDVTLGNSNSFIIRHVPACISLYDTLFVVSQITPYFQNYDSFCIEKIQPVKTISGTTYSVTNDSAIYVISFFSPTKHTDWHNIYLNNKYSALKIAQ